MGIDVSVEKDPVITATMGIGDFDTELHASRVDNAKYGYKIRIMPVLQV
jgi:hypothetical protein